MLLQRPPRPRLAPFVRALWATSEPDRPRAPAIQREHLLPTGHMHIAFRLGDAPLRLYRDSEDPVGYTAGRAVVGGARAAFYIRDASGDGCSVGAQLQPGVAELLFGVPCGVLAGRHTPLDELWGYAAALTREQLLGARTLPERLDVLESLLSARLPTVRGLHPAVAYALERLPVTFKVSEVVAETGYSHRHFVALFRDQVGLTPKTFCRVARFQKALDAARANPGTSWADLALRAGYSDQPHFSREFREFAGVTPEEYRRRSPAFTNHVPVGSKTRVNFVQDGDEPS